MSRHTELTVLIESLYLDLDQTMSVSKNLLKQPVMERFLYTLNQLIKIVSGKEMPQMLLDESHTRIKKYINFLITFNAENNIVLHSTSTPDIENATLLSINSAKYLQEIITAISSLKNNSFDEFCRLFSVKQPISSEPQQSNTSAWRSSSAESTGLTDTTIRHVQYRRTITGSPGDVDAVISQLLKTFLISRQGCPTLGFLNNLAILNFTQDYLTQAFNADVLNKLLDAQYGLDIYMHNQRSEITTDYGTLYAYLRFALIGLVQNNERKALTTVRGQTDLGAIQVAQKESGQSLDLLSAVLRGRSTFNGLMSAGSTKIFPSVLVQALIGGETKDVELYEGGRMSTYTLPPLIFHFIENPEATKLLLKNILYVNDPFGFPNSQYHECKKYQFDNAPKLLKLIKYVYENAKQNGSKPEVVSSFLALVSEAFKTGKDVESLKTLHMITKVPDKALAIEDVTEKPTGAVLTQGLFSENKNADPNNNLITRIATQLQVTNKNCDDAKGVNEFELHTQKQAVLEAAKDILEGKLVDFADIKSQNPRYSEGLFSNVSKLINEVDSFLKARTPSGPTMSA